MKRFNFVASIFAVTVLALTVAALLWLRWRAGQALDTDVRNAVAAFDPPPAALGEPSDPRVDFEAAEAQARSARLSPYIRDVAVTKTLEIRPNAPREIPVVPYDLASRGEGGWAASLAGYRRIPLEWNGREYGHLYLDVDTGPERVASITIAAASAALLLATLALIARIYSQQSAIVRVGSELEQRKKELIRLERLALAGQLTANLLHDLKKPVLSLRRQLEDLRDEAAATAAGDAGNEGAANGGAGTESRLGQIVDDAEEQIRLFFQMLNDTNLEKFVRSGTLAEEYVDIRDSLRMSARLVHYERGGMELSEDFVGEIPPALAQPFRLVQVFSNLILNAYQALGGQGRVTLSARAVPGGVVAEVRDNGPGVPPDIRESIFEPFFTTKAEQEGSGLGLAICRLIVEEMRGKITLETPEGGGSIFRVWLPTDAE